MRILFRYVLREFLLPLFYCTVGILSIYVLFELFTSFSRLVASDITFLETVKFFAGYIAPYFKYVAPACLMLASLYTMWNFCRHSELIAMRASGVSFLTIVRPLLLVAAVMALFVFWVDESYVQTTGQWAKNLREAKFSRAAMKRKSNIVFRNIAASRDWMISEFLAEDGSALKNVQIVENRADNRRKFMLQAEKAQCLDGQWWFTNPKIQHYDVYGSEIASPTPSLDALSYRNFPDFNENPRDFILQNLDDEFFSIADRKRYLELYPAMSQEDKRDQQYKIWSQWMAPLACLVITFFAIPAGIASGRQSVFKGILGALGMFFGFYSILIGFMMLSRMGCCNPVVAALMPDAVFLVIGSWMLYRQR